VAADLGSELAIDPIDGAVDAIVELPGSKSITNRALICAALAGGTSTIRGALRADDTEAMLGCLRGLGSRMTTDGGDGSTIVVEGNGGRIDDPAERLDARMSGTTARFVLPLLGLASRPVELTGHPQLLARPMGSAIDGIRQLGVSVDELGRPGHLPVAVGGTGSLPGGPVTLPGDVSSQFLSGLLLVGPTTDGGLELSLSTSLVSRPYVEMTIAVMSAFGARVRTAGDDRFAVDPAGYRATNFVVEPDASAASYFFAAAAVTGGRVMVEGLGAASVQGDLRFVEVLGAMGCEVSVGDPGTEVRGTAALRGVEVDLADLSDTAPTLAVVAAFAEGPTRVTGIGFIRRKETDRIAAIVTELRRCGVDAEEEADGFVVHPSARPVPARIETYDDHRMAMSFAILGLRTPGTVVLDPGCVSKTFPAFFETLDRLRPAVR
jgi:3-phosphoshikimate 1-carboxyvinyltransferase